MAETKCVMASSVSLHALGEGMRVGRMLIFWQCTILIPDSFDIKRLVTNRHWVKPSLT
jgi:hypothetical protein